MVQKRFIITGRVQGVGFRQFTLTRARQIGVSGYVRNLPDGSVECVASGSEAQITALVSALRRGPPGSDVDFISESGASLPSTGGFQIR